MEQKPRYWFAAKRYGWGWGLPLTWQGWVVYTIWFAVFLGIAPFLGFGVHRLRHVAVVVAMVAILIAICSWKGEPPRWRWGE